jgi:hypothetical protein
VKKVKGRGNGRGLKAAINCLNWLAWAEGEEERRQPGAVKIAAARDQANQRKRKGGRKEKGG